MSLNGDKVCISYQICELFAERFDSVKDGIPFLHQIHRLVTGNEFIITNEDQVSNH